MQRTKLNAKAFWTQVAASEETSGWRPNSANVEKLLAKIPTLQPGEELTGFSSVRRRLLAATVIDRYVENRFLPASCFLERVRSANVELVRY